jgi:hypothetical protein
MKISVKTKNFSGLLKNTRDVESRAINRTHCAHLAVWVMDSNHRAIVRGRRQVLPLLREKQARDGGASRDRTDDPLVANQVLSQLSYGPVPIRKPTIVVFVCLVGLGGVAPPTSPLSGVRSN